jgi:hypothetical protein
MGVLEWLLDRPKIGTWGYVLRRIREEVYEITGKVYNFEETRPTADQMAALAAFLTRWSEEWRKPD